MKYTKIYIAGHLGMVGSSIFRILKKNKKNKIICNSHKELDLTNQSKVKKFFNKQRPDQVYLAAAKTGGIYASINYPAEFIYDNLMIETNIINSAFLSGVKKILFLGSSCSYPRDSRQPMRERELLTGPLEPTNESYSIAKIAGIKLCESYNRQYGKSHGVDYRSVIPTNVYGPGDNYDYYNSHVIPALFRKFNEAKIKQYPEVILWGTGKPKREFLFVDDIAKAAIKVMNLDKKVYLRSTRANCSHINIGTNQEISIKNLAKKIKNIVGYKGRILFDKDKPDGVPRKIVNSKLIRSIGWHPKFNLEKGLQKTYKDFLKKTKIFQND